MKVNIRVENLTIEGLEGGAHKRVVSQINSQLRCVARTLEPKSITAGNSQIASHLEEGLKERWSR